VNIHARSNQSGKNQLRGTTADTILSLRKGRGERDGSGRKLSGSEFGNRRRGARNDGTLTERSRAQRHITHKLQYTLTVKGRDRVNQRETTPFEQKESRKTKTTTKLKRNRIERTGILSCEKRRDFYSGGVESGRSILERTEKVAKSSKKWGGKNRS